DRLTADGMLTGMSQSNKSEGREDLQRSDYRVIGQCAMGLFAQLSAALRRSDSGDPSDPCDPSDPE
ncbi:hypothetical protein R0J87_20330, partial [Halomonas sp. SIMBA_159]